MPCKRSHSDGGGGSAGDTAASTVGTATTITVADGAPSVTAATPVGTGSVAEPVSNVATVIPAGATLELASAYSGTVAFAGATGTLKIDNSSSFSGTIAGQLAIGDVIDLADITAGANATITYSGNNSPGTLTVSDGTHTANIALQGNYSLANFTAYSDGHGGTSVIDPPTYVGYWLRQIANGRTTLLNSNSLPYRSELFPDRGVVRERHLAGRHQSRQGCWPQSLCCPDRQQQSVAHPEQRHVRHPAAVRSGGQIKPRSTTPQWSGGCSRTRST